MSHGGGNPPSPWVQRAFAILKTGPRPAEEVISAVMGLVPPGRAHRANIRRRNYCRKQRGAEHLTWLPDDDRIFWAGARYVVMQSFSHLKAAGRLVQYEHDGKLWLRMGRPKIRLTPEQSRAAARRGAAVRREKYGNAGGRKS